MDISFSDFKIVCGSHIAVFDHSFVFRCDWLCITFASYSVFHPHRQVGACIQCFPFPQAGWGLLNTVEVVNKRVTTVGSYF